MGTQEILMMRRTRTFTLIELLVVIAIIAILVGLLLPTIAVVKNKARNAEAKSEIRALETALAMFESTYGRPVLMSADYPSPVEDNVDAATYTYIINVLQNNHSDNTRSIRMLDVNTEEGIGNFKDPWDNDYQICLDLDFDGDIDSLTENGLTETIYGSVAIWSFGRDKTDGHGEDDDVNSWSK